MTIYQKHSKFPDNRLLNLTVFLVDDDEPTRDALCLLFRSAGLQVESYASANDFMENIPAGRCGCVVTDLSMSGPSGLDLQRHIVDQGIHLPVILITAFGGVRMAVRAIKAGAFDFVEKPFSDQGLVDTVRDAFMVSLHNTDQADSELCPKVGDGAIRRRVWLS